MITRLFIRTWRMVFSLIALIGLACAFFLLFRETGEIRTLPLPDWALFRWVDHHGTIRNIPAFALLAAPFLLLARGRRQRRYTAVALALFIAVSEFVQLAINGRSFDLLDIAAGWFGLAMTWGAMELIAWPLRRRRARRHEVRLGVSR